VRAARTVTLGVLLVAPWLAPAAAGSSAACAAAADQPHAALVVGTGGQTLTFCVALDSTSVSGLRLIQLAGSQFGVQYRLGFGGQAVCQLAGVGPQDGDCFGAYPDFWGYWHGDGGGGWSWAGSGAGSASITDGDIEGWVWGSGDSGATHASPPSLEASDICEAATPSPDPTPGGGGQGGGSPGTGGGGGGGDGSETGGVAAAGGETGSGSDPTKDEPADPKTVDRRERSPSVTPGPRSPEPTASASPSTVTVLAAGVTDDTGGPPLGAALAVVAVIAFCLGGWLMRRRRPSTGGH
jgi:hypothetical protein